MARVRPEARPARFALPLIGLLVVASGCTDSQGGTADPDSRDGGAATSQATSAPKKSNRPQEFKLDGLDPCKALTADQMAQLGLARTRVGDPTSFAELENVPICDYSSNTGKTITYGVSFITTRGYDYWNGNGNLEVTPTTVAGYDASLMKLVGDKAYTCDVAVDVADGQHLHLSHHAGSDANQEELCRKVTSAAEMVLDTLPSLS
ncbi:DUF3558 domain-containing protein [Actinosynnema pretiosum]|nr:DUF3558 domain-containing protein [Actinosynnema pretiosum]